MKKLFIILSAVVLGFVLLLTSIFFGFLYSQQELVIASLPDYESKELYTNDGFQDYTDYAKYTYDNISIQDLESSEYFTITTADDVENIILFIEDFEGWVEACGGELKENYDFDKTIITDGDFFYIDTKEGESIGQGTYGKFDNYSVYYFDVDAQILYYFHNNI